MRVVTHLTKYCCSEISFIVSDSNVKKNMKMQAAFFERLQSFKFGLYLYTILSYKECPKVFFLNKKPFIYGLRAT